MSSLMNKNKMKEIVIKKTAPIRLIKCYVCNKLFNTQPQFNHHLEQHQNKLNRTNVEEIQRKTQQSFRSKRQPSAKTVSIKREQSLKTEQESPKQKIVKQQEDTNEQMQQQQQKELEEALRESQILLQKIEFLTQVTETYNDKNTPVTNNDDDKEYETPLENQYQLYLQLVSNSTTNPQVLILKTKFEDKSFQNYQEQLKHLDNLSKLSINPQSIGKISSIIKNICKDVLQQLKNKYGSIMNKQYSLEQQKEIIKSGQNVGEVAFCSICFNQIEVSSGYLHSQLGTIYHKECYNEEFQ